MGELSGGKSATSPTFCNSTSVRTRIDLQYSQTVCTLLDHRNTTFAPQFGHVAAGWVIPQLSPSEVVWQGPADAPLSMKPPRCKGAPRCGPSQNLRPVSRAGGLRNPTQFEGHNKK